MFIIEPSTLELTYFTLCSYFSTRELETFLSPKMLWTAPKASEGTYDETISLQADHRNSSLSHLCSFLSVQLFTMSSKVSKNCFLISQVIWHFSAVRACQSLFLLSS